MLKQTLAALIAVLGLSGCAAQPAKEVQTLPPPAPPTPAQAAQIAARTCGLPLIADTAPLRPLPGTDLMTVPIAIDGNRAQFLLDIGMNKQTAVSPELMAKLGLPVTGRISGSWYGATAYGGLGGVDLGGVGGMGMPYYDAASGMGASVLHDGVSVSSFTIGRATGHFLHFMVAEKGEIPRSAPYDGLLTGDFFRKYDSELDFGGKEIYFYTPTSCTDPQQAALWSHREVAVIPVSWAADGRLQMQAMIQDHLINAEIDTASERTVMRRDIAELYAGLKPDTPGMMPDGDRKDGMGMRIYVHTFPQIIFADGGVVALNVPVLIQDNSMIPAIDRPQHIRGAMGPPDRIPDLAIGMDVLQHLHMLVVPGQERVYVSEAEGADLSQAPP